MRREPRHRGEHEHAGYATTGFNRWTFTRPLCLTYRPMPSGTCSPDEADALTVIRRGPR